ncbi:hypothetical protein UA32_12320 [Photobacterium angustum]|uniref:Uncharacterized protein n=1 Tax=Photobacterium angustum TaxID=661 RepID=A0ABX5GZ98_PHOAN|nr:hypothetical protein [Photobacterium angustum]KJG37735.1 hypothetical protein UA32_12320 [Photobacterium angustum]PSX03930.1 hypothetical protein C0W27_20760 [Photobacterium angustum]
MKDLKAYSKHINSTQEIKDIFISSESLKDYKNNINSSQEIKDIFISTDTSDIEKQSSEEASAITNNVSIKIQLQQSE